MHGKLFDPTHYDIIQRFCSRSVRIGSQTDFNDLAKRKPAVFNSRKV